MVTDPNSSKENALLSFVTRDVEIDECYTKMNVGGRVVVPVASEGESITFQWMDAWAHWGDKSESAQRPDHQIKCILAKAGQRRREE